MLILQIVSIYELRPLEISVENVIFLGRGYMRTGDRTHSKKFRSWPTSSLGTGGTKPRDQRRKCFNSLYDQKEKNE